MAQNTQSVSTPVIEVGDRAEVIAASNLLVLTPEEDAQAKALATNVQPLHEPAVLRAKEAPIVVPTQIHPIDDFDVTPRNFTNIFVTKYFSQNCF